MVMYLCTGRSIFIYTHIDTNIYMYIFKYTGIYSNIAIEKRLSLKVSNVCVLFFYSENRGEFLRRRQDVNQLF